MKNLTLIISILFSVIPSHAQDYLISFSGNGASNTGETVKVENLTQGKSISLSGSDILHLKATVTGNDLVFDNVYGPLRIYPNPSNDYFTIEFGARKSGPAVITIYDLIGREISSLRQTLTSGIHSFRVTGLMSGIYTLKVFLDNQSHLGRLFSTSSTSSLTITYNGNIGTFSEVPQLKSATEERFWQYNSGDLLKFIGTSWKFSTVLMDVPTKSKTISFKFIECTDADGNNYPVVQIGDQWWMAENLKTTRYNDGAPIPNVTDNTTWRGLTTDAYCWYNNDATTYKNIFGALYNWFAVSTNKLAPTDWHVPTDAEWKTLSNYLGGDAVSGGKLKETGTNHWRTPNTGATNETGFTAFPGGYRQDSLGTGFVAIGDDGGWWSITAYPYWHEWWPNYAAWFRSLTYRNTELYTGNPRRRESGNSVRCILGTLGLATISTAAITNLTTITATTGGNITNDGGYDITVRGVCWNSSPNPTTDNNKTTNGNGAGSFTSNLTGLTANTTYYVRAYATNSIGTAYGNEIYFTTGQNINPPTVITTAATSIAQTTATSGGNVTADGGATVTARGVCLSTNQNPTTANSKTTDGTGTGSFISHLTGLTEGTTYYIKAYATNSAGTAYGDQQTFTTLTFPTVTTSAATSITQTNATSGGNVSSDGGATVTSRGVCWSTSSNPTVADSHTTDGNGTGSFSSSLTGLTANTPYYVRAYATNSVGTAYGNEISFTTGQNINPPTVLTTAATSIAQTTATSGGNVTADGGATVTARGVCWSTSSNPTTANSKTTDGSGTGNFTSSLTGLVANTLYHIRAYATNSVGTSYGSDLSFTTLAIPAIPTVTTTAATNIAQTTATSGGTVTADGGASVTARGVCWSTSSNPTTASSKTTDGTGTGSFTSSLTGLTANTLYHIRAYAINSVGTSYGSDLSFTTFDDSVVPTVTTTAATNIAQTTATSGGNVTVDGGATVTARGVCWSTTSGPLATGNHTTDGNGTGTFVSSINGLTAGTLYYVRAYATNSVGTAYGVELTFTTLTLPAVTTTAATSITQTTATSGGNVSSDGGATVTARGVCWSTSQNPTTANSKTTDGTGTGSFTSSLTGLTANTPYYVRAYATNSVGTAYGNEISFTTGQTINPPTVLTTTATSITQTTATSGGNVTSDGGAAVTARGVCWSTSSNPTTANSKTTDGTGTGSFSSSLTGLTANTLYHIRAYATNSVGTSYGSDLTFTTLAIPGLPTVTTTTASGITQTTASSGGNVTSDGGVTVTARGVCWSTSQNPTTANSKTTDGTGAGGFTSILTGLTSGNTYYVRAYAINGVGTAYGNQVSFIISLIVGDLYGGGIIISVSGTYPDQQGLIAATSDQGNSVSWWNGSYMTTGATSQTDGFDNTQKIVCSQGDAGAYAAKLCRDYRGGGYSDWYLPSISETQTLYDQRNLPGIGSFASLYLYWSSTEYSDQHAWFRSFTNGAWLGNEKSAIYNVRAIRSFATKASAIPSVTTACVTNITQSSATCGGNVISAGETSVTSRGVCWSTSSNPTTANSKTTDGTGTGSFTSSLTGLTANTLYHIRAYAINSVGTSYGSDLSFTTLANSVVPTVTTTAATNIAQTTATSGGNVTADGGATVTARGVCWSTASNPTTANSKTTDGTGTGSFTSSLTGLTANTPYYARAYATNSVGTAYGNEISFTTGQNINPPTVLTTTATSITQTTATSGGNVTSDGGAAVTARGVCWSTSSNPTITNSKTADGTGTGSFTSSINGLTANTLYHIRAYATNSVGTSYGSDLTFTTLAIPGLPTVTTTTASGITQTTASSGGNVTSDGGVTVTARGVCWSTSQNPTTANSKTTDGTGAGGFTSILTGLTSGNTYYVRAYAINGVGTAYGNQVSFIISLIVGDLYGGGIIISVSGTYPDQQGLIAATSDQGNLVSWSNGSYITTGATSETNGFDNTQKIVCGQGDAGTYAAKLCRDYRGGGYSDWYLPSISETQTLYDQRNLPGIGSFVSPYAYWGSTEYSAQHAWAISFTSGGQFGNEKGAVYNVRAIRSFATKASALPTVTTNCIANITLYSATGGGNVISAGEAGVTSRGVCWSTSPNPTTANSKTTDGTGTGSFTSNLSGLTANTLYYVRAYATNSIGTAYGNEMSFTTGQNINPPTVLTTAATSITQTTATAGGNITADGGASVTARGVCWSTASNPTTANSKTADGTGTGSFTSSLTGLTANTLYHIRAYATNSVGTSYGSDLSFTTLAFPVIPTVTTTAATNIAQTTATSGGNVTSDGGAAVTARGVCWSTTSGPLATGNHTTDGNGTGTFVSSINGLTTGTLYYVRAYATNSAGTAYGDQLSFTTLTTPTVTTTAATSITQTSASSGGNVSSDGGATVTARGVCWSTSSNPTTANSKTTDGTGTGSFTSNLTGLTANTLYYVRAYATNSAGTAYGNEISFTTGQNINPPTVLTTTATSITQTTATSGGNVTSDGGAAVTARGVCWSTSSNPTTANSKTADGTGTGSFTSNLTGLTANTLYHIRAYATNSVGTSYGSDLSFTTLAIPVIPTVTTTAATNIAQTTATSGGIVTADGGASVTARGVCWSTSLNPTTSNSKTADGNGTGTFVSNITGLTANTLYHVRAYATNSVGTSYGSDLSFTTLANPVLPTVTTTAASIIAQTTATSGGNVTADGGANVTARGVCWSTSLNPTTANTKTTDGSGTGSFTSSLSGLTANTLYHIRAYATNSVGTSYGSDLTFTTLPILVTPTVTTTAATNIAQTTATSGGNVTADGGASVTARGVCWSTSANPTTTNSKTSDGSGTGSFTSNLTGLTANTLYHIRAYATNSVGTSYGTDLTFTTLANPVVPTVTTTAATNIAQTTATSGGNVTADGGATVTARGVCWSTSLNPTTANSKTTDGTGTGSFTSNLTGLTAGTTYYVRAYATNSSGTGYGDQISFPTTSSLGCGTATDIDGNIYNTVTIGNQCWMVENLKTTKYNDGTAIPNVTDNTAWGALTTSAYCWNYNDAISYKATYGAFYNWFSVNTGKLCPTGWKVPTDAEWTTLTTFLGGESVAGGLMKEAGFAHWTNPNTGATNSSGFTGLPGCARNQIGGFCNTGSTGLYWSYTSSSTDNAWARNLSNNTSNISRFNNYKKIGYSVRCVRDGAIPTVATTAVTNITQNTATSGGNVTADGGETVTARGICWNTSAGPLVSDNHTTDGSGTGSFVSSITGLSSGTLYYVRAYATNTFGTAYGNEVTFTAIIRPSVTTIDITDITQMSATSGGNVTSDGGATVTARGICWNTATSPTIALNYTTDGGGTGSFESNIIGLLPGILYYVRAYAINSVGLVYGNELTFTTLKLPIVITAECQIIAQTSAVIGGNVTNSGGFTVTVRGHCWSISQNPTTSNSKTTVDSGIGNFSSSLTGLTAGTTYYARAYATNNLGTAYGSQVGSQVSFTTTVPLTDYEGNVYKTVIIGTQEWMAENLKSTRYKDGTSIPNVTDNAAWGALITGAYCWNYNDAATYLATYGALYNWFSANTGKLCPTGWKVPTDAEWTTLTTFLGGESVAGGLMKEAGTAHWTTPNTGATNSSCFTGLPGCARNQIGGFCDTGITGLYWSSTSYGTDNAWARNLGHTTSIISSFNNYKKMGYSVRCVKE